MRPLSSWLFVWFVTLATAAAQEPASPTAPEHVDLLASPWAELGVSVYQPRVPAQIRVLRSDEQAADFAAAAWDELQDALFVDYDREQIVVVAWGPLRFANDSEGASVEIVLERAELRGDTLHATVRTHIPPGPGIDIAHDRPGRTRHPSLFFRTPRTDKVVLDVVGARRRDPATDLRTVTEPDLVVRLAPDASPSRDLVQRVDRRRTLAATTPEVALYDDGGTSVLEVAWGTFGAGLYRCDVVGLWIEGGVARVTVRAENRAIVFYSGPGEHRPGFAFALPKVRRVALHVERTGRPLPEGTPDFTPSNDERVQVTVDTSRVRAR